MKLRWVYAVLFVFACGSAHALDVKLDDLRDRIETVHNGQVVRVERVQDEEHAITGSFAKTSRKCPPFCIQPNDAAPGVRTVSEVEVFDFLEGPVVSGKGVLVDARLPSWFEKGTIPGSVNMPFTVFESSPSDPALVDTLYKLGVRRRGEVNVVVRSIEKLGLLNGHLKSDDWDFTQAKEIVLWCNGPWCNQSPRAIHALMKLGYPAERLHYYRGGMQLWQLLGLTTIIP
ncbi:MAG: rhodanese-like domain-containing protein [Thiotrichales bacterium]